MAPSRPFWKGYLKLSLVSCPIAMFPASSSSERVSFRQINKSTGNRLKQQLVDSVTGDVVEPGQKGRGYEIGRNQFMPVEDEEPMKRKNMVGLGRVVISRRERIVMLEPFDKGLIATTLHYVYEIRNAAEYFDDVPEIKLPGEMVELAEHILETKAGHFDASEFEDRYENAVVEMLKRKQAGLPPAEQPETAAPTNVVNLMDALRRSVEGEKPAASRGKTAAKNPAKEAERRPTKGARKAG